MDTRRRLRAPARSTALAALTVLTACVAGRASGAGRSKPAAVEYGVTIPRPASQYAHVTVRIADPRGATTDLAMPAWTPGSYKIREFARHVYDLAATDDAGHPLRVERRDKQTWRVRHNGKAFSVSYRVFADEVSVRTSHINDRHASLLGASIFMYVPRQLSRPATVVIEPPDGWDVHVALPSRTRADGATEIQAASYDALVDAPIELGTPTIERFSVGDSKFEYVLTGLESTVADPSRLAGDAAKIVAAYDRLLGGLPMKRYLFLVEADDAGGGGLEHFNSTSMIVRPGSFSSESGYARAARLAAHEFFHAWNVKRIHDRVLGPFDYAHENHTELLWFHEGFTETMEALAMMRSGLVAPQAYLRALGQQYTAYRALPGRNHDPLSQLSHEAWTKGYMPAANHRNVAVSYYTKGDMVGLALDLELRLRSGGKGSLPGLFTRLMASHGRHNVGITAADITAAASAEAGEPMAWFFARHVNGTEEVELAPLLRRMGVAVSERATGGIYTGLRLASDGTVDDLEVDSPAAASGLMREDRLVAVDGHRADSRVLAQRWLEHAGAGKSVAVAVYRGGHLVTHTLAVEPNQARTWTLALDRSADAATAALRDDWLAGPP